MITRIALKTMDGDTLYTKKEWLKLPRIKRIQNMAEGRIKFLDNDGYIIPAYEAVVQLKLQGWLN